MHTKEQLQAMLGNAINLATLYHAGQKDKGGWPYILHPLHVMNQLMFDVELAIVGVLHDIIEDTPMTLDILRDLGYSERVLEALDLLSFKPESQTYDTYIEGICTSYDAVLVKRKDLKHNSDIRRLKGVTEKDMARSEKYYRSYLKLTEAKRQFESQQ